MADGLSAAGLQVSLDDIVTWNDLIELTGYWWPSVGMQEYSKWVEPGLINASKFPSPYPSVNKQDLGQLAAPALRALRRTVIAAPLWRPVRPLPARDRDWA
ncbi:hypothetical protein PCI56_10145 [Plesiomonas shigelloides subsp. oncorhynchi]|nr:hypothetical protein [Plesiomonas shigelloides]